MPWPGHPVPVPSGPRPPPAAHTAKDYKHLQQGDKTVYCSAPPPPPAAGEAGRARGALGPRQDPPIAAEVFPSEGSLRAAAFVCLLLKFPVSVILFPGKAI